MIHNNTPFKKLFKNKPSQSSMHVFGCLCYPWLRPYCPHKLSPRSQKCDLWFTVSFTKGIFTLIYHHQSFSPYAMLFFMIRSFLFETKMIWHPMLRILLLLLFSYLRCSQHFPSYPKFLYHESYTFTTSTFNLISTKSNIN